MDELGRSCAGWVTCRQSLAQFRLPFLMQFPSSPGRREGEGCAVKVGTWGAAPDRSCCVGVFRAPLGLRTEAAVEISLADEATNLRQCGTFSVRRGMPTCMYTAKASCSWRRGRFWMLIACHSFSRESQLSCRPALAAVTRSPAFLPEVSTSSVPQSHSSAPTRQGTDRVIARRRARVAQKLSLIHI